jgi:predicted DNA-binding ribbon-helix-helix protein
MGKKRAIQEETSLPDVVKKRSVVIGIPPMKQKTSVSLENGFWSMLRRIAIQRGTNVNLLITGIDIDQTRGDNLSSALRLFVLNEAINGRIDMTIAIDEPRSADEISASEAA